MPYIWGEGESVFEARGEATAGVYGVSKSAGRVWASERGGNL